MNKPILAVFAVLFAAFLFASCSGGAVLRPVSELKTLPAKKIFELGAERYIEYDFDNAVYYYSNIIALYPEDIDYQAMAAYEIGFIYFQQKKYPEALVQFDKVNSLRTASTAPQILANQMKRRIEEIQTQK